MVVSTQDADCYELNGNRYAVYGFEYKHGFMEDNGVSVFFSRLRSRRSIPLLSNHRPMGPFLSRVIYHLGQL